MSIMYVGDLHGRTHDYGEIDQKAARLGVTAIVQVGDAGFYWPGDSRIVDYFKKRTRQGKLTFPWYFADGNHEDHNRLDEIWYNQGRPDLVELLPDSNLFHVRRGGFIEIEGIKHVFCGGARSTDRQHREMVMRATGVRVLWDQEAPNAKDLQKFFDAIQKHKPDVIVTHDAPASVPLYREGRDSDPTAQGFDKILALSDHRPKRWYFGHHHQLKTWLGAESISGVDFYGCGLHGQYHLWDSGSDGQVQADSD